MVLASIAILRADHSSQYQLGSQTGARSARHSLRPQTSIMAEDDPMSSALTIRHLHGYKGYDFNLDQV